MKNRHILYVGENDTHRKRFESRFKDFYTIHIAASADEALKLVRQFDIDVVVAVTHIPGDVGAQVLGRIDDSYHDAMRYIVINGGAGDDLIDAIDNGHIYYFFQGAWDERAMKLVIDNALELASIERDRAALEKSLQEIKATLNEREGHFNALLEAAPDAIVLVDEDGQIVFCNFQSEQMSGYPRTEILGQPIVKLIPGRSRDFEADRNKFFDDPRPGGGGTSNDLYLLRKDGTEIPVEIALTPLNTGDGLLLTAAIRDVTERKRSVEALHDSEQMLRAFLEAMPLGVVIADEEGKTYYTNRRALEITGRSIDEIAEGEPATQLFEFFVAGTDTLYPSDNLPVNRALAAKNTRIDDIEVALADGSRRSLEVWGSPVYNTEGAIKFAIATVDDITERKAIEAQLRQAQKMEAIGQLTSGISHDFNNLLAIILTSVDLLSSAPARSDESDQLMNQIMRAVRRGESLTRRLLAFSRRQTLQPQVISVNDLVNGNLDALRRMLTEAVEIQTDLDGELWMTKVDPGQLEDALLNLAINSRDAMSNGGTLTIRTANLVHHEATHPGVPTTWSGDFVMLSVADTGGGMSAKVLEHIFEPFFTTKGVGEGSGLGMSMVYGFAKQTGGHVTVESSEGEGTTVSICLQRETAPVVNEAIEDTSKTQDGGGEAILVVEDNEEFLSLIAASLKLLGYSVLGVKDGHEALVVLDGTTQVDLVLSDVVLPGGMNGIDLLSKVRERRPGLTCLLMSGYADFHQSPLPEDVDLLNKPFRMKELARQIRKTLGRKLS